MRGVLDMDLRRRAHRDRPVRVVLPNRRVAIVAQLVPVVFEALAEGVQLGPRGVAGGAAQAVLAGKGGNRAGVGGVGGCVRRCRRPRAVWRHGRANQHRQRCNGRQEPLDHVTSPRWERPCGFTAGYICRFIYAAVGWLSNEKCEDHEGHSYPSSAGRGCFSRRRYAFWERCTLWEGVLSRPFTGASGFGTRTMTFFFSRLRLIGRHVVGSAGRGGGRESRGISSIPRSSDRPSGDA